MKDKAPAFPMGYHRDGNSADQAGMDLRDYFAAKATEDDIRAYRIGSGAIHEPERFTMTREEAKFAYADAMLEARAK